MRDRFPSARRPALATDFDDEFLLEFTRCQRRLYLYILSQTGRPHDADEVLSNTNVVLLKKHDQFEPGTNFYAWACKIATFEVYKKRDRRRRDKHVFSDEFVGTVAAAAAERDTGEQDRRRKALGTCLGKLREKDRDLIQRRYAPTDEAAADNADDAGEAPLAKEIARQLGRPANSVYQSLGRIRKTLLECIRRELLAEQPS